MCTLKMDTIAHNNIKENNYQHEVNYNYINYVGQRNNWKVLHKQLHVQMHSQEILEVWFLTKH